MVGAPGWLSGHGWQPRFHELTAVAESYQRTVMDNRGSGGFLTAERHP
jgi:hypothetical protein